MQVKNELQTEKPEEVHAVEQLGEASGGLALFLQEQDTRMAISKYQVRQSVRRSSHPTDPLFWRQTRATWFPWGDLSLPPSYKNTALNRVAQACTTETELPVTLPIACLVQEITDNGYQRVLGIPPGGKLEDGTLYKKAVAKLISAHHLQMGAPLDLSCMFALLLFTQEWLATPLQRCMERRRYGVWIVLFLCLREAIKRLDSKQSLGTMLCIVPYGDSFSRVGDIFSIFSATSAQTFKHEVLTQRLTKKDVLVNLHFNTKAVKQHHSGSVWCATTGWVYPPTEPNSQVIVVGCGCVSPTTRPRFVHNHYVQSATVGIFTPGCTK
eukprot:TRINITY_DN2200_c0_g1_i1.p1 TRINITY_DN2200_c0_g1~~TRINITY_DN2200_c0_g1_i1.p1  ORF type:complete len:353 (+),score=34.33 TRINITY_DN2200_c0_g1_i1:85-1059(+)